VGYWPTYPSISFYLPASVLENKGHFASFYASKYQGRRLQWVHYIDRAVVQGHFRKGKKEFVASLAQAVVMLCFNKSITLSFDELVQMTKLEKSFLKSCLAEIASPASPNRFMRKSTPGNNVRAKRFACFFICMADPCTFCQVVDEDVFTVMEDFAPKLFRIKLKYIEV
jgi:hypothetical protein